MSAAAAPRRIVTGHDDRGRSVVLSDGPAPVSRTVTDDGTAFHEIWSTAGAPAPIPAAEERDPTQRPLRVPPEPEGTVIRVVDIPAGGRSPMHRTESVDYGVVLDGELHLVLDDGSATALAPGDIVVQRGTDHAWENRSGGPARMAFILVDGRFADSLKTRLAEAVALYDHEVGPA
ncbi:cupin domain-containing protein [Conexibacter woesei]|uniref:cupin domain-containing protein n=1 Tax=Conexibacter woesei TaxID=191495 RepID=UPI0003F6C825|nr:cupin domain-containing protein [Conexibacter woesei]